MADPVGGPAGRSSDGASTAPLPPLGGRARGGAGGARVPPDVVPLRDGAAVGSDGLLLLLLMRWQLAVEEGAGVAIAPTRPPVVADLVVDAV